MKLKNWTIQFDFEDVPIVAHGEVYGNPKFKDGTTIATSRILNFDRDNKILETLNNTYTLED